MILKIFNHIVQVKKDEMAFTEVYLSNLFRTEFHIL